MQQLPRTQLCRGLWGGFITKQMILQIGRGAIHHHPNNWQSVSTLISLIFLATAISAHHRYLWVCLSVLAGSCSQWVYSMCNWSDMQGRCSEDKAMQATLLAKSVRAWLFCPLILFANYSCFPSPDQDSFLYTVRTSDSGLTYVGKELKWKSHSKP